jgi:hypothetical protein
MSVLFIAVALSQVGRLTFQAAPVWLGGQSQPSRFYWERSGVVTLQTHPKFSSASCASLAKLIFNALQEKR